MAYMTKLQTLALLIVEKNEDYFAKIEMLKGPCQI